MLLKMVHATSWIALAILVLAFIFFIVSVIILEYGTKVSKNGNLIIPWYYWMFFVGAGLLFLTYAILLMIPDKSYDKKDKKEDVETPESWVQGNVLYTEHGQKTHSIPQSGSHDPNMIRDRAVVSPHYDMGGNITIPYTHHHSHTHSGANFASNDFKSTSDANRVSQGTNLRSLGNRSYLS